MPAQSRRLIDVEHDDPWGFGAPEGAVVDKRPDPHGQPRGRVAPVRRESPLPPSQPPRPADAGAILLTPGTRATRGVPPEPAGDARLQLDVPSDVSAEYVLPRRRRPPRRGPRPVSVVLTIGLVLLAGVGAYLWAVRDRPILSAVPVQQGTFVLSSQPAGAEVRLDGVPAGRTPVALTLTPGDHTVTVTTEGGVTQQVTARVPAGESASQHLVLDAPPPPVAAARKRGRSTAAPVPADGSAAAPSGAVMSPNAAAVAPASTAPSAPVAPAGSSGFVTFDLPFTAQVYEGGKLLGSTSSRLRVAPGTHTFTLVSPELGFDTQETVVVAAGQPTRHVVEQHSAPLSVNARPWAEVFISGRSFGETPLANISLPIGTYQVMLRHPTLGEREVAVTVRYGAANRLAVDMRQ